MTEINPNSQDMEVDNDRVSPIRPITTKFVDRYKTLLQESPPRDHTNTVTTSPDNSISQSSLRNMRSPSSPRKTRDVVKNIQSPSTIKNEDRGLWREEDSLKVDSNNQKEPQQQQQQQQIEVAAVVKTTEKKPTEEVNKNQQQPNNEKKVEQNKKTKTIIKKSLPTPSTSKASSTTTTTHSIPRYMQATQSFKTKFESKTLAESSLGVRTSKKISKPSRIPRRKPIEKDDDEELKRLSFKGNYVPMAARVKSFEKGLRQSQELQGSISTASTSLKKTTPPKFKEFKFATSERAKRYKKE